MEKRRLGSTDMHVTRLGFGGARIGYEQSTDDEAARLLNGLLDAGVNFIDTAACYVGSEEQIGRVIAGRRSEYYLATKAGHVVDGATGEAYSEQVVSESIERSLKRLNTEAVDLVQIHSCSAEVLQRGEAANALLEAKKAGKTRYIGFSGDGDAAAEAIGMGIFDTLQTSFNLVDQSAAAEILPMAMTRGMGVIAKRPIANAAFGREASPSSYADEYWRRSSGMSAPADAPDDPIEFALRFTLSMDEIDTAIVGTSSAEHALANLALAAAGPLDPAMVANLRKQFAALGSDWNQLT